MTRSVRDKETLRELRTHGFYIRGSGVVVDGPRNVYREPIPGSRVEVHSGGVVSFAYKQRHDYIYGMTESEKKRFAENPDAVEREIRNKMIQRFPILAKAANVQSRLQWGAYEGTKDFSPTYFSKTYLLSFMFKDGQVDKTHRKIDALTGFHFVVHTSE